MTMVTMAVMSFFMLVSFLEGLGVVVAGEFVDCCFKSPFGLHCDDCRPFVVHDRCHAAGFANNDCAVDYFG